MFVVLVLSLCACNGAVDGRALPEGGSWTNGRYLKGNSADLIIFEGSNTPCDMSAADETVSFEGLTDGDRIRVYLDYIRETWPAQAIVFAIEKTEDGELQDIDPELMESLREYGWID